MEDYIKPRITTDTKDSKLIREHVTALFKEYADRDDLVLKDLTTIDDAGELIAVLLHYILEAAGLPRLYAFILSVKQGDKFGFKTWKPDMLTKKGLYKMLFDISYDLHQQILKDEEDELERTDKGNEKSVET